jgi:hypothetical protein
MKSSGGRDLFVRQNRGLSEYSEEREPSLEWKVFERQKMILKHGHLPTVASLFLGVNIFTQCDLESIWYSGEINVGIVLEACLLLFLKSTYLLLPLSAA